jgi:hypothetical protein
MTDIIKLINVNTENLTQPERKKVYNLRYRVKIAKGIEREKVYKPKKKYIKKMTDEQKLNHKEYMKRYRENHEPIDCDCGGSYTITNKGTHNKTVKHQFYMLKKQLNEN